MTRAFLASIFIITAIFFLTTHVQAQQLNCQQANGLMWCYNPSACGQPCNDVCNTISTTPIPDSIAWWEAQNTEQECIEISRAFGLGDTVDFNDYFFACLEDDDTDEPHGPGLQAPIYCSAGAACPDQHRNGMDAENVACTSGSSRRSICPCNIALQSIVIDPEDSTNGVDSEQTITALVTINGSPASGIPVLFAIESGPNAGETSNPGSGECFPNDDCTTDGSGFVSWTYFGDAPGTDTVAASYLNGSVFVESNRAEISWLSSLITSIPTVSEIGLLALAGVLGIAGYFAVRRSKAAA